MHNCSSCSKEVNDVSRLINGKCFNCTYLEQLAKTKLVVQEHNLKVAKVEDCIP
jgi:DNA-directed RNA polymerase subunit RPC12/RpoP